MPIPPGYTLIELVVAVAVVAIAATVSGVALANSMRPAAEHNASTIVQGARRAAVFAGIAVTVADSTPGRAPRRVTAYPDGSAISDTSFELDRLIGRMSRHAK